MDLHFFSLLILILIGIKREMIGNGSFGPSANNFCSGSSEGRPERGAGATVMILEQLLHQFEKVELITELEPFEEDILVTRL